MVRRFALPTLLMIVVAVLFMAHSAILTAQPFDGDFRRPGPYELSTGEILQRAEQGDVDAQFNLGLMFRTGVKVSINIPEALKWYGKASDQGDANAQVDIATIYYQGHGVPKSFPTAIVWWNAAAAQGHHTAMWNLGHQHRVGEFVPLNLVMSYMWFSLAAERADPLSVLDRNRVASRLNDVQVFQGEELIRAWNIAHPNAARYKVTP